jgi:hypothetical protein
MVLAGHCTTEGGREITYKHRYPPSENHRRKAGARKSQDDRPHPPSRYTWRSSWTAATIVTIHNGLTTISLWPVTMNRTIEHATGRAALWAAGTSGCGNCVTDESTPVLDASAGLSLRPDAIEPSGIIRPCGISEIGRPLIQRVGINGGPDGVGKVGAGFNGNGSVSCPGNNKPKLT